MKASELVAEFWRRIRARDWNGLGLLLAEDLSVDSRTRVYAFVAERTS